MYHLRGGYGYLPKQVVRLLTVPLFRPSLHHILLLALMTLGVQGRGYSQGFLENGMQLPEGYDTGFMPLTPTRLRVDLSGSWNYSTQRGDSGRVGVPSAFDFEGRVTFDRTFEISADQLDRYRFHLVMLGVNYACDVSVNGEFILNHAGGSTSFYQTLPENALQVGAYNHIRVVVSNSLDKSSTIPTRPHVWGLRNYGGITRDIYLLCTPKVYVREVNVIPEPPDRQGAVKMRIVPVIEGEWRPPAGLSETLQFVVDVADRVTGEPGGTSKPVPVSAGENAWVVPEAEVVLPAPRFWSPRTPDLYTVRCMLVAASGEASRVIDEYHVTTGIRTVGIAKGDFLLEGKRMILRGVTWYEDHPSWGSALTYEQRERDIALIKGLGADAIRFVHPPHPAMISLCDRYGLFALIDFPLVQVPPQILGSEAYRELAQTILREMILRDRGHPSVLAWGLGHDLETSSPLTRSFLESLTGLARSLDRRPLYLSTRMLPGDTCTDLVEIAAVHLPTRDGKTFQAQVDRWRKAHPNQPVIVSQVGTEVQQENRSGYSDPRSQEAQARFFLQRFETLRHADVDGAFAWSFSDWRGERPALTVHSGDPTLHMLGLVSARREKRIAYDAVRALFRGEKFAALPIGSYNPSAPIIYVIMGFVVLVGMAWFYNANRRFRENLNRSVLNSYNFFGDIRDQHLVPVSHTLALGVVTSLALALVASSFLYHFREDLLLDNGLSYLLISDALKDVLVRLIWNPPMFILYCTLFFFVLLLCGSLLVYLLRAFVKTRALLYHALSLTVWATSPLLVLIPIGMIVYRIMESSLYVLPAGILTLALLLWVILRLLKAVSIVYDVLPAKMYSLGIAVTALVAALVYFYYDSTQFAPLYLSFLAKLFSVTG